MTKEKDKSLTPFQKSVYKAVRSIPYGEVRSYKWVAEKIGVPQAFRAVGQALHKNPCIGEIPCHRVVRANGSLGGFKRGVREKARLLNREGLDVKKAIKYNKTKLTHDNGKRSMRCSKI